MGAILPMLVVVFACAIGAPAGGAQTCSAALIEYGDCVGYASERLIEAHSLVASGVNSRSLRLERNNAISFGQEAATVSVLSACFQPEDHGAHDVHSAMSLSAQDNEGIVEVFRVEWPAKVPAITLDVRRSAGAVLRVRCSEYGFTYMRCLGSEADPDDSVRITWPPPVPGSAYGVVSAIESALPGRLDLVSMEISALKPRSGQAAPGLSLERVAELGRLPASGVFAFSCQEIIAHGAMRHFLVVRGGGYATRVVPVTLSGFPLELVLERTSKLKVVVPSGEFTHVGRMKVEVSTPLRNLSPSPFEPVGGHFVWRTLLADVDGAEVIEIDVPHLVPLDLALVVDGNPVWTAPVPLVLGVHEFRVVYPSSRTLLLSGRLRYVEPRPDPVTALWIYPAQSYGARYLHISSLPFAVAQVGARGHFDVKLPPGRWVIGPSPSSELYEGDPDALPAAIGRSVVLEADGEMALDVYRGNYISGRVRRVDGGAVPYAIVVAVRKDTEGFLSAGSDASGTFKIGPLAPGEHRLAILPGASGVAESSDVYVESGETDVELVVRDARFVAGRVMGFSRGRPRVWAFIGDPDTVSVEHQSVGVGCDSDGRFRIDGLLDAKYDVLAFTSELLVATTAGLASTDVGDLQLVLEPGSCLLMRRNGDFAADVVVEWNGRTVWRGPVAGMRQWPVVIPAGDLTISWACRGTDRRNETVVHLRPGETRIFDLRE